LGEVRLEHERLLVELARLLRLPRMEERVAEIVEGVRIVGSRGEGGPEPRDRAVEVAGFGEERAQVVARLREVRLEGERALEGGARPFRPPRPRAPRPAAGGG